MSLCEISHILQYRPFKGKIIDYSKQLAIINFENIIKPELFQKLQNRLGGVQKICEIIMEYPKDIFIDGFPFEKHPKKFKKSRKFIENDILPKLVPQVFLNVQNRKIMFAVSVYPYLFSSPEISIYHLIQFFNSSIMDKLKEGLNKVSYFKYPEKFLKSDTLNPIWPHHVLIYSLLEFPNAEIIFGFTKESCYIAKTIASDNPNVRKLIDEHRPNAQFEISVPPKLAQILINFLNLPRNGRLLDPFCGTGTILMMAMLQNIDFYGVDIDHDKITAAKKNIFWLAKEFNIKISNNLENVFKLDAQKLDSHFKTNFFDGIATEPYLGPLLKKPLTKSEYQRIIKTEIQPLYHKALLSMKKVLKNNGKIAIISPSYRAIDNNIIDFKISKIAKNVGLKPFKLLPSSKFEIKEDMKFDRNYLKLKTDHIVLRNINVFQKIM
ncbi:MAG: TRM11 family SAM-dependent methyltransferase [Candidatus Helarchaeota archaeon]